jgi:hypothetical protein
MKEKDHPRGACLYCVHCHLTNEFNEETGERIYGCLMMETSLTKSHYTLECSQAYTEAND